ncbi:lipoprotein-releasing system permease protein [Lishizhenia tianjinensis]|uniref:Lipoprotein-releasing system permease protein n=1 Tax=Lishizhenia tianjinensis TaxID=477690 RepID=A0A1I7BMT9_9FLAO|nr:lipoprotein-releasing system permease protein [Lishizhenia tianjinensis]
MNFAYYIAKRLQKGKDEGKKISRPIVRISVISIAISLAVNLITIAVVTGFQEEVRDKVAGFGSHAQILKAGEYSTFEGEPIVKDPEFEQLILNLPEVKSIQSFAYKPALLQSKLDTIWYNINGIDTFQLEQEIQGVVVKGAGAEFDWSFFKENLVEGKIPDFTAENKSNEILISDKIAQNLNLKVNEKTRAFFVENNAVKKLFTVAGIFNSGLEEFDKEIILADIRQVQDLNDWGVQAKIRVADTMMADQLLIYADVNGGNGNYKYDWGRGYEKNYGFTYCDVKDTVIRLIVSDYWMELSQREEDSSIPDTAYLKIQVKGNKNIPCEANVDMFGEIEKEYLNEDGTQFAIHFKHGKSMYFEYIDGKGSSENYIGGYEISVKEWDQLSTIVDNIKDMLITQETVDVNGQSQMLLNKYNIRSIKQDREEIFLWLDFLDLNVYIILILMLLIGIINMGSGLLVLIITKTNFIGLFKALGSSNWNIRKVFLYQVSFLIIRGLFFGNLVGIGFCVLQEYFTIIPLDANIYYLNAVPVNLSLWHILALNVGTLLVCVIALIIPSYVITKISPVKAMKLK